MDLDTWLTAAAARLDLSDVQLSPEAVQTLLNVARDAAHDVERVAAPLTTFLVGVAVGRGHSLDSASEAVTTLLLGTPAEVASNPDTSPE